MLVSNVPAKVDELDAANSLFLRKDFASARAAYIALAAKEGISPTDAVHAVALCSLQLGDPVGACLHLASIGKPEGDDWRLIASANAQAGHVREAVRAFGEIAAEESAADIQLCEEIAMVSAKRGDKENAWRFYRAVEQVDPGGMAMERLNSSAEFAFANDFFGYGRQSLLNYARGVKDGAIDWGRDSLTGLWQLIRHPVDSVKSFAGAVAQILSKENLKLLLSPTILASKLGSVASRVYWSAWESCKRSAVREYSLELNDLGSQQKIHEIAAGRMVGYVAPDLILLVLSAGAGAAGKASDARKVVDVATATARAEEGIEAVNLLGRSARFIEDTKRFSALRRIAWLEERTWELIKASPRLEGRLEKVANWISDIRHVPGAKVFTECMAARLHLVDVEGYLFQLQRAAEYARKDELVAIGKRFHTDVALPGRPIRRITGEADLELRGGVLVETKFRSTPLTLDEGLHLQLLKYDRAVAEGQFKSIRLECNNAVSMAVRERCSMLSNAVDIADNLVENVEPLRASHGVG